MKFFIIKPVIIRLLILFSLISVFVHAAQAELPDFGPFQKILNKYLVEVKKNDDFYTTFKYQAAYNDKEIHQLIAQQKKILKNKDLSQLDEKKLALAFWINSYNFLMIAKIFKDGFEDGQLRISSVKDMGSFFNPYAAFKEKDFEVGGKKMTLVEIEKKTLLGEDYKKRQWKDARVHFAVNCASVGCPPLLKQVYRPDNVELQLTENVKRSLASSRHMRLEGDTLWLTHLFKWYDDDFEEETGSIKEFVKKYIDSEVIKKKVDAAKKIKHIKYDWKLNRPSNFQ